MTLLMRRILLYGFIVEVILFFLLYYFGSNGKPVLIKLLEETKEVGQEITVLQSEINQLNHAIQDGKSSFAKEKIARERLHMKKDKEIVYFIKREG